MVQTHHIHDQTPKPSKKWLALSDEQRLVLIRSFFLPSALEVHGVAVFVVLPGGSSPGWKGEYLRQLEKGLRTHLGEPLEVYCEQQKDQNKPRDPIHRQRIIDWLDARKVIKEQAGHAAQ